MPAVQDILVFFQTSPALDVEPVAWARYEASKGTGIRDLVEEEAPVVDCILLDDGRPSVHVDDDFGKHARRYRFAVCVVVVVVEQSR